MFPSFGMKMTGFFGGAEMGERHRQAGQMAHHLQSKPHVFPQGAQTPSPRPCQLATIPQSDWSLKKKKTLVM